MRMKEPYEAYLDDYNCLDVYMSKNFLVEKPNLPHEGYKESYYPFDNTVTIRLI